MKADKKKAKESLGKSPDGSWAGDKSPNVVLEQRLPIWQSISEFYLDTELQPHDYNFITRTFLDSGLSLNELKAIDRYEVLPVLKANLINTLGEWRGFDETWLNEECTKHYLKRNNRWFRWKIQFYDYFLFSMRKDHWTEIENRMKDASN
ncbi:hypothetical protein SAMN05421766_104387 [Zobellia uliginosa]|uniref:DUF7079 domain-containing protein n=1 Tax=Zobellia uliginosa TaxID=143224 RepID=A0ABY1KW17_9FLAO|nr:hypothetical protein [Zobellia uliginosa]SIS85313.1 hypothetical protein SAMN05421766_104387 [Zobellia uliginosa]